MNGEWFRSISRSWSQHFGTQFATLTVLVATFVVLMTMLTATVNMRRVLSFWGDSVTITAYLQDFESGRDVGENVGDRNISAIEKAMRDIGPFSKIEFVSKEQARIDFQRDLQGLLPDLVAEKGEESPFPASFIASIGGSELGDFSAQKIETLADRIRAIAGVEDVSYGQDWVKNYSSVVGGVTQFGFLLALALLFGSVFVIGNSLRNSLSRRREEIEILELVGATPWMIRKPYLLEGLFMGFLSGAIALVISALLFYFGVQSLKSEIGFFALGQKIQFLSPLWMVFCLFVSSGFGLMGSYLTVCQMNHGYAAARSTG